MAAARTTRKTGGRLWVSTFCKSIVIVECRKCLKKLLDVYPVCNSKIEGRLSGTTLRSWMISILVPSTWNETIFSWCSTMPFYLIRCLHSPINKLYLLFVKSYLLIDRTHCIFNTQWSNSDCPIPILDSTDSGKKSRPPNVDSLIPIPWLIYDISVYCRLVIYDNCSPIRGGGRRIGEVAVITIYLRRGAEIAFNFHMFTYVDFCILSKGSLEPISKLIKRRPITRENKYQSMENKYILLSIHLQLRC